MAAQVSVNKKLNIVIPIELDSGKIWIHSVPLSREIFDTNYMLLTKTLSFMYMNGVGPSMAPRIAALALRDVAKEMNEERDISQDLIHEIYRITNVVMPRADNGGGWQTIPFMEAKNKKLIDEQTISEVENALIYFIVASAVHLKNELPMAYQGLRSIWSAQTTLSNVTEFSNSLTTSTPVANIGEKIPETPKATVQRASSVPS